MTLGTLIISIAVVALILTLVFGIALKAVKNWPLSFLQNFVGALFIFSGWVKAIDPLGTAFKMEQYFAEFETTFSGTKMDFLAPLFPWLAEYAVSFSVIMIVFEIVLGIMLLIGSFRKVASWAFLLLVIFFTFLTGFTYLTGFVPEGVNFFQFGQWGPYVETNMKVTDCGCFGDFLKLEPKVSFFKDVFLLIPAILFVIFSRKMHQLFSKTARVAIPLVSIIALTLYCYSNYKWDLPHTDFRPFKVGVNIAEQKAREVEAMENVEIIGYELTNKSTGEMVELPFQKFMEEYKNYPKEEWEFEQIQSEPAVAQTKISDFEVSGTEGENVTEEILSDPNYSFMVVAYKLKGDKVPGTKVVVDTIYQMDTIRLTDSIYVEKSIKDIQKKQVQDNTYQWKDKYMAPWRERVNPVLKQAEEKGYKVYAVTRYADPEELADFKRATESNYPFYTADEILLKTIIRSNPGVVLMKNGEVIQKWHYKKLPSYLDIKSNYMD